MKNYPDYLTQKVEAARTEKGDARIAKQALGFVDLTSLNKTDTEETIRALAKKAVQPEGHTAALCVYPEFVKLARALCPDMNIATVINFPLGDRVTVGTKMADDAQGAKATLENTRAAIEAVIADGANEIDIVLDYQSFLAGDTDGPLALLKAANEACYDSAGNRVALKVIVETAAFDDYNDLKKACALVAAESKPEFLKTSTGKHAGGGATLEVSATLLEAAAQAEIGVKNAGGVKTTDDCAQFIALAEEMFGTKELTDKDLRFGASGVVDNLLAVMRGEGQAPQIKTASMGY